MNEKMLSSASKKLLLMTLIPSILGFLLVPVVYADGIHVDGVVVEAEWIWWFTDDSQPPNFDAYWYLDSDDLYIAIVTDDTNDNVDVFRFAFRTHKKVDWWIEIKPGYSTMYRASGGDWEGYWRTAQLGLPHGVTAASGKTDGKRSYELCIELSMLGMTESELPEKLKFWIMVEDGSPEGSVNYYPPSRADWFFIPHETEEEEAPPKFYISELPLGTIMALFSTLAALTLFALKRPIFRK